MDRPQILLTNDDGIRSPGLWAAAEALSSVGYVTVVAPHDQSSGAGRSLPGTSDGIIHTTTLKIHDHDWTVYSIGGSPAQAVLHGILEIMPQPPDLVVSGINYGENVATSITVSGTVGAAMEAAACGFPAMAVSTETDCSFHRSYSAEIDFSTAGYFTAYFARLLLEKEMPPDVNLVKVDVPADATPQTPWQITRLSRQRYYVPLPPVRKSWEEPARLGYRQEETIDADVDSDVHVLRIKRLVSVTPLSLDMTSRVDFGDLDRLLRVS